jgi:hypothetical protein
MCANGEWDAMTSLGGAGGGAEAVLQLGRADSPRPHRGMAKVFIYFRDAKG